VGEGCQGVDHAVDGVGEGGDFTLGLDRQLAFEIAVGHRRDHPGDAAHLAGQVAGHGIDVVGQVLPGTGYALDLGLATQLAFGTYLAGHARHFGGERAELIHHRVDRELERASCAHNVDGDLLGHVADGHDGGDICDVAVLAGQVAGHEVDAVGQVFPGAGHATHVGLAAQLAFRAHLAGHARHFGGERPELIHHRVDG